MEVLAVISSISSAFAALFTGWAAYEAMHSVHLTRKSVASQLLYTALHEYYSSDMANALSDLVRWKKKHGKKYIDMWINDKGQVRPDARDVENARVHVMAYFFTAYRLYRSSTIEQKHLCLFVNLRGYHVFRDIVVPMENRLRAVHSQQGTSYRWEDTENMVRVLDNALKKCE